MSCPSRLTSGLGSLETCSGHAISGGAAISAAGFKTSSSAQIVLEKEGEISVLVLGWIWLS
ncbi:MAG: hypothetical protein KME18_24965 [Phormidium tanganyikae FI6-MK23]|nr:hypothetical protein [Phormidium tanganyikae FI6-MK23]